MSITTTEAVEDSRRNLPIGFIAPDGLRGVNAANNPLPQVANSIPGAISVDFDGEFGVDVVSGRSYLDNLSRLVGIATDIDARVFLRDHGLAHEMMKRNMEASREEIRKDVQIPSILLFKREDEYVGFASQRVYIIPTIRGDVRLLYWTTRAFEEEYRGREFGRRAVQIGRVIHRDATWGAHRTQVEIAVRSMQGSGVFKKDRFFPWDALYSTDKLARQLLNGLFDRVAINGITVDQETGVSRDDYSASNKANEGVDVNHPSLVAIHRKFEEFGIIGRNSVYGIGEFA